jgi:Na+-transporting methylmalonyl-CoA/oxaloacetate decarboxylase beta subunit
MRERNCHRPGRDSTRVAEGEDHPLGVVAFGFSTIGGVLFGKPMYKLTGGKVRPLIGSAGVIGTAVAAGVLMAVLR